MRGITLLRLPSGARSAVLGPGLAGVIAMRLVGMLDSPYVRRSAITATLLGLSVEHSSVSVFRHMEAFRAINPLIKAPTLVCDDGTVITDSALIVQHFEDEAGRSLRPTDAAARRRDLALTGIGIVAADKAVGVEYEEKRPESSRYRPWQERIGAQLATALDLLGAAAARGELWAGATLRPADIMAAVAWGFCRFTIPHHVNEERWPALAQQARACEALDAFKAWPIDRE
jgi:glutathione S-transferase